jgi:hypothetical protein
MNNDISIPMFWALLVLMIAAAGGFIYYMVAVDRIAISGTYKITTTYIEKPCNMAVRP